MTYDPEADPELKAELEVLDAEEAARESVARGIFRIVLVAPAVILGALPIAILFKSLVLMLLGIAGGLGIAMRGGSMAIRGRRELRASRERRQLPVATVHTRS